MPTWTPDPSFYPSPRMAMKAAPETLAYVAAFDPDRKTPDALAVVDVNPKYLVVQGLRSSRIPILDTKPDPRVPKIVSPR